MPNGGRCSTGASGGLLAVALAALSPEFYRRAFLGVPEEPGPMLRFTWVGGSIWGIGLGGLLSVILSLIVLRAGWKRRVDGRTAAYLDPDLSMPAPRYP